MSHKQNSDSVFPLHSVKKFYILEYIYVLLESVAKYTNRDQVFESFKRLKIKFRLGESKYKKLSTDQENLTKTQVDRYKLTFRQVIEEAKQYGLIDEDNEGNFTLNPKGGELIQTYQNKGAVAFNQELLKYMESKYEAFRYLIEFLYNINKKKPGLLIIPNYSPRLLKFEKSKFRTTSDIQKYSKALIVRLQEDIKKYLGKAVDLEAENRTILNKLVESGLISRDPKFEFDPKKYNVITKRFRDFWINYFLQHIYRYDASMASFEIWIYRGKQIGIMHVTEFYPNFNGRVVYPTSIIAKSTVSDDFSKLYTYPDGNSLFMHNPEGNDNQEKFVDFLVKAYFEVRKNNPSYFVNLPTIREIVCYNMKISEPIFQNLLEKIYKLNLAGKLRIRISLEVDKLPEESKAMYLKKEPVMVDGKYRNIIAIDVAKGIQPI